MCKGLLQKTRCMDDILMNDLLHQVARGIFNGRGYRFGKAMIKDVQPREDIRSMHQGTKTGRTRHWIDELRSSAHCSQSTGPFTFGSGATRLVRGSHLWD